MFSLLFCSIQISATVQRQRKLVWICVHNLKPFRH